MSKKTRRTRVAVVGVGAVGQAVSRMVIERGGDLVAAVNRPGPKVGRDIGDLIGLKSPYGVDVVDNLEQLAATHPDIAVVAQGNYVDEMAATYRAVFAAGANVICAGTETSFAWVSSPSTSRALDRDAKAAGVTLTGSGNQDFLIVRSGSHLAGAAHHLDTLAHRRTIDLNLHGVEVARQIYVGYSAEQSESASQVVEGGRLSIYETFARQVVADLGLQIASVETRRVPVVARQPLWSASLQRWIDSGLTSGSNEICTITTQEGPRVQIDAQLRLLRPGEKEQMSWELIGEPNMNMVIDVEASGSSTAAQIVNRIPDVIAAPAGYVTFDRLGPLTFHPDMQTTN